MISFRRREFFVIVGLVAVYLLFSCTWQGVRFADESSYLDAGAHVRPSSFLYNLSISPLYATWFKLLSLIVRDAVWRYLVSWALLVATVSLVPWSLRIQAAWLYTLVLVCSPFFNVWPYVSLFASVFVVTGICLVLNRNLSMLSALTLGCGVSFVTAYARPEYTFAVYLAAATVFALALAHPKNLKMAAPSLVLVASMAALTFYVSTHATQASFGIAHTAGSRSGVAFAQHVNMRAAERGFIDKDTFWGSDYALKLFHVDPGHNAANTNASIGDFVRANPRLFLAHLIRNLRDPHTIALLLFVLVIASWPWIDLRSAPFRPASAYALLIATPVLVSSLVIYPREHYATVLFPAFLLLALQIIQKRWIIAVPPLYWPLLLGVLVIAAFALRRHFAHKDLNATAQSNVTLIRCFQHIESSQGSGNRVVFDIMNLENVYLAQPRTFVTDADIRSWKDFETWVPSAKPGWVIVTPDIAPRYHVVQSQINQLMAASRYTPNACPSQTGTTVYTAPKP